MGAEPSNCGMRQMRNCIARYPLLGITHWIFEHQRKIAAWLPQNRPPIVLKASPVRASLSITTQLSRIPGPLPARRIIVPVPRMAYARLL